ncbi:MAG: hypothetical protein JSS02_07695, partial [Planctomycetes bacterium]|nr:hypothetical protein [Planctomycetota bacterium]
MFFGSAAPTPYDLRFSIFGIPVRVHPLFWVSAAAMGWDGDDPRNTVIWIACVFISILVHELGHAMTANYFRWRPDIVLYMFGGYASYVPTWQHSTGRAILVTAAGPLAGFFLFGVVIALDILLRIQQVQISNYLQEAIGRLEFINLWWGLVNLLPVY